MAGKNNSSANDGAVASDVEAKAYCEGRKAQIDSGALTDNPYTDLEGDKVSNGAFASDTMWTKGTGWTISGNNASSSAAQGADSDLEQLARGIVDGVAYQITMTVSGITLGNVTPVVGGTEGTDRATNATFTEIIDAGTDGKIMIRADLNFDGDVDDVIVKPLSPASSAWRRGFADALAAGDKLGCAE